MHFWSTFFVGFGIGSMCAQFSWLAMTSRRLKRESRRRTELVNMLASQMKEPDKS